MVKIHDEIIEFQSTKNFIRFKKSSTANSIDITTEGITRIGMIEIEAFL